MKVLIVDDRADNRLLLVEQLRLLEAHAVTAESGVKALREIRSQSFDLVVSDLLMPEMDGFQLCYLLKTDPNIKKTPVVIYTANYATKQDEEQAKNLGADDFITRPIDEEQLASRIQEVMKRAQRGVIAQPRAKPEEGFFREYSSLLVEKLEDQLITAEENAKLQKVNAGLQRELQAANSHLKSANVELQQANEELEAYSYSVSHDLRAPVRTIRGMVEILRESLGRTPSPEAANSLHRIEVNLDRMDALINGLLAHSRMRNVSAQVVPVDLEHVVDASLAGLDFAIREARGHVHVRRPLPVVLAHEQPLEQIVTNLVENALKFVGPGVAPEVTIAAENRDGIVRLTVRDNGIGISPEGQARLFKVFERLHSQAEFPGSGLGLAIVRRGIERMGGTAGVESAAGAGSTFWIELKPAPAA